MDLGYRGKSVIVTGGSSNINRGNVLAFAKEGANVVCADIDEKAGQRVVAEANALGGGGKTIFIKTDVTSQDSVQLAGPADREGVRQAGCPDQRCGLAGVSVAAVHGAGQGYLGEDGRPEPLQRHLWHQGGS